ncbi:glycosyltransferase family 39 protein [Patescibacteria group bacterium]|nr:glycosyltransferase family 39 protein [Patescibacteria group bacterium]
MQKKTAYLLAGLMLAFMLVIAFFSMLDDSAIMDEVAHLPAGYSYITQQDMRLNPEHPPLIKDLSGGMVWLYSQITGTQINFPEQIKAWQTDINGQWEFGFDFMYREGNNADLMLLLGRIPMLLILLLLGIYVFKWARELFGNNAALLSLSLFSFSPTFLAHGRFVTTDVAAAAAIFIASYYFIKWLKNPSAKNLIIAGLVFGAAQLAKFSVFLLIPLFFFVAAVWILIKWRQAKPELVFWKNVWKYLGGLILLMATGYIFVVWPVYIFHTINYPIERQQQDTKFILSSFGLRPVANLIYFLAGLPVFRALAQYGLGLAMVVQRAAGGNTSYFLGEISAAGSRTYFPLMYLIKETLALHIFTLIALFVAIAGFFKNKIFKPLNFRLFLNSHIAEILMLAFIALYWYTSVRSPLNIGVRHILPTFPFVFLLISGLIVQWFKLKPTQENSLVEGAIGQPAKNQIGRSIKYFIAGVLISWQIVSVVSIYPSFLAYFNEAAGGPASGYKYVTDSNLDWGQDLKRLSQWTEKNNIDKIYVDYFGGATSEYYLNGKFASWWGTRSPQDLNATGGYLAVSATFLQGGRGKPAPGYKDQTGYYNWLNNFKPVTTIGYSIFVYYVPPGSFDKMVNAN